MVQSFAILKVSVRLVLATFATVAIGVVLSTYATDAFAAKSSQSDRAYPREVERAEMLGQIDALQTQALQIDFSGAASPAEQNFLRLFKTKFWPVSAVMSTQNEKASLLYVMIDRALYNDEAEKKSWELEKDRLENEIDRLQTSDERRAVIRELAEASTGLDGDLPRMARQMLADQVYGFTAAELPLLNRLTEIMTAIQRIANDSPISRELARTARETDEIQKKFIRGDMNFEEAARALEALAPRSHSALGQYVATEARELLNEAAIIRTKLAAAKGFANWADFQLATKERLYKDGYRSVSDRVSFLRELLQSTKATHKAFLEQRAKEISGVPADLKADIFRLRSSQNILFAPPTDSLISEYFPVERIEETWRTTMIESGFTATAVDRIRLDSYPRPGKQSHAYMMNARSHQPNTFRIDARTLNTKIPRQLPKKWMPALIYIVQNMRTDGPSDYSTAFHEGGHGLDFSHRQDVLGFGQDSSYAETHSMTMERFFDDLPFLLSVAKTREGHALDREKAEAYLANVAANRLSSLRAQSLNALYDLELWNHAYKEGGEDFVSRSTRLSAELSKAYMFVDPTRVVNGVDGRFGRYSTSHFYSGQVRYIGYVYAEMAAEMTYVRLLDILEATTGRRSLLNQPSIAKLLTEGYYKTGFLKPFPLATEDFARKPFNAREAASSINAAVDSWVRSRRQAAMTSKISSCDGLFTSAM